MSFEHNEGQTDKQVEFLARGRGYSLFLTSTEAVLALSKHAHTVDEESMVEQRARRQRANPIHNAKEVAAQSLPSDVLRLRLVGANPAAKIEGSDELPGKSNYYIGNDVAKWRTNVAQYTHVHYKDVYPGVELVYYGNQGQLESDFVLAQGADPKSIRLSVLGARRIRVEASGDLALETAGGKILQHKPVIYQEIKGERMEIKGRYVIKGRREVGFVVEDYDRTQPLVIDPVLSYSTYLGGSGNDVGDAIAADSTGNAYIAGHTSSTNFPPNSPSQSTYGGGFTDSFVTKLTEKGELSYSIYLGGSGSDQATGIAVDSVGNAYVAGLTTSTNFPTLNAFQGNIGGGLDDAFVTKLTASGALSYSTYLGGNSNEQASGIAVDAGGNAYVTGDTQSTNFPTLNAYQGSHAIDANNPDVFVTKLASNGALSYSTYLGGNNSDVGWSIAVDAASNVYVTGDTFSTNFPTLNAFQSSNASDNNHTDVFVTKLTANGGLSYSTYLGGESDDIGKGIAIDSASNAYITGLTFSTNFPTTQKPSQGTHAIDNGRSDAFVTKLTASGNLSYSTYLGGNMTDAGAGIAVDPGGNAYVTGSTESTDFPPLNAFQSSHVSGFNGAFVSKLTAVGELSYSTYLGGNSNDVGNAIAVDSAGNAHVTGSTQSTNFPTPNAYQANNGGGIDAFVTKLTVAPQEPLIFIPGFAGSYLWEAGGNNLWLGHGVKPFTDYSHLIFNPTPEVPIYASDVIRRAFYIQDVYGTLLRNLEDVSKGGFVEYDLGDELVNGYPKRLLPYPNCDYDNQKSKQPTLFVFPYDWRLDIDTNADKLKDYIQCVEKFYPGSKVNILAHSTGGLMARRYVLKNPQDHHVDKLISIAAPWLGAPKAINVLETGEFFDNLAFDNVFGGEYIKQIGDSSPGAHALLPSPKYFDLGGRPFFEGDWSPLGNSKAPVGEYQTFEMLQTMLDTRYAPYTPGTNDLNFHAWHQDSSCYPQDDFRCHATADVKYYNLYGDNGRGDTIGRVFAVKKTDCSADFYVGCVTYATYDVTTTGGDGTVPLISAERKAPGIDLNDPNGCLQKFTLDGSNGSNQAEKSFDHTSLAATDAVFQAIMSDLATSSSQSGCPQSKVSNSVVTNGQSSGSTPSYYLRVFGPTGSIVVTDSFGNDTAPPLGSVIGQTLPGVSTTRMDPNAAIVSLPAEQTYTVTFTSGTKPLEIDITKGTADTITQAVRYLDLSLPAGVTVKITFSPAAIANLQYDGNGDGNFESTVAPTVAVTGNAAQDIVPPTVSVSTVPAGNNALVTITSSDAGSGVKATSYSLDGIHFQLYTSQFTVNPYQAPAIYAFADDNVGNRSGLATYRLISPGIPVLVSEANSTRAIALDSVLWLREPFKSSYAFPWGSDQRTRIILFALNFDLSSGESAFSVTATAQDGSNQVYSLPVEFVGKMPGAESLTCVVVKLNESIGDVGDVLVQISYHGITSNRVRVGIGHIGGGPPDSATSLPASRPRP